MGSEMTLQQERAHGMSIITPGPVITSEFWKVFSFFGCYLTLKGCQEELVFEDLLKSVTLPFSVRRRSHQ